MPTVDIGLALRQGAVPGAPTLVDFADTLSTYTHIIPNPGWSQDEFGVTPHPDLGTAKSGSLCSSPIRWAKNQRTESIGEIGPEPMPGPTHNQLGGHGFLGVDTGVGGSTAGVIVTVTWYIETWYDFLNQVGPAICCDPGGTTEDSMGINFVNDVSISGKGYTFHLWDRPVELWLEPDYYDQVGSVVHQSNLPTDTPPITIEMETNGDGTFDVRWEGVTVQTETIPANCLSNTIHGVHAIDIQPIVGTPSWIFDEINDYQGPRSTTLEFPGMTFDCTVEW